MWEEKRRSGNQGLLDHLDAILITAAEKMIIIHDGTTRLPVDDSRRVDATVAQELLRAIVIILLVDMMTVVIIVPTIVLLIAIVMLPLHLLPILLHSLAVIIHQRRLHLPLPIPTRPIDTIADIKY